MAAYHLLPPFSPRVVVVPIISCIIGFPLLVMLVICGLRYRARRARISAKKTHNVEPSVFELASGPSILSSRCSNGKAHRQKRKKTLVRFKPMPEIDLDTVVEEKSEFDAEVTASDLLTTPDELIIPEEPTPPASFRAYRYMGPVQTAITSPLKTSPFRSAHAPTNLDNVTEELEFGEDVVLDVSDDECLEVYDDEDDDDDDDDDIDDDDACDGEEGDSAPDEEDNGREQTGSSGSSDSDTVEACFSLSPKQVTKSPTGVHLTVKKVDGAVKRRHSSPVKVNFARNRVQRSSGKADYSHANRESPQLSRAGFDYIDRELMPEVSPRSRSHSVKLKHPASRRAASFTIKKRRGESLKLRSKSFSRSISQEPDGQDHRPRVHLRSAHNDDSASTSQQLHNGVLECDVHVVIESGAQRSSSGDCIVSEISNSEEASTKTVSDTETFISGNETDRSVTPHVTAHDSARGGGGCSLTIQIDRKDPESPMRRVLQSPRTACSVNGASESCQVPTLEKITRSHRHDRGVSPPTSVSINIVNEFELKYRQEDGQVPNHYNKCLDGVDKEDERSTLV